MDRLDIAISTYGPEGLARIVQQQLPHIDGVRYIVSWQEHKDAPIPEVLASRSDIFIERFGTAGQSHNRNNALDHCSADLVLIADDDVHYSEAGIRQALAYMEKHPDTAIFSFIVERPGAPAYPAEETVLSRHYPKNYHIGGCELAIRRSKAGNLRFHPDFGLNSPDMHGGEDELFHLTAMRRGLECRFAPIVIGSHPHGHTGFGKPLTPATLRAQGCISALMYPRSFAPRLILKALRLRKNKQSTILRSLRYMGAGAFRAFRLLRTDRSRLW